jgi:hypothetical protein
MGTVLGTRDSRVIVRWSGLGVGRHLAASLVLASAPDEGDRENKGEEDDQEEQE